jgi:hypothetical protein
VSQPAREEHAHGVLFPLGELVVVVAAGESESMALAKGFGFDMVAGGEAMAIRHIERHTQL